MLDKTPAFPDVLGVVPDLFFGSRISSLARQYGRSVEFARSIGEVERFLAGHQPRLVLVDLGARGIDAREVIRLARNANVEYVVAFGPHKDVVARQGALAAGADRWVTNQRLLEALAELLAAGGSKRG